ncbi:hypothetical protein HQQ81_17710 [Microbacteriaceae bacterium VKM Ac-2854]|nr:hypothetical protein [Microbacteriaceae bacterium VKM Ac-2854]
MLRTFSTPAIALALAAAFVITPLTPAFADDVIDPATGAVIDALAQPGSISIAAGSQVQYLTLPIAAGVTPNRLIATVTDTAPTTGTLSVIVSGRIVQTLDAATLTALDVPLEAGDVVDGVLAVGFQLDSADATGGVLCGAATGRDLTIDDVSLVADTIAAPPSTLAEFFSPAITTIDVVIPDGSDDDLRAAGLSAVGSLADRYDSGTAITLREAGSAAPALNPAQSRVVEFTAGSGDVTTTIDPTDVATVQISGDEAKLAAAGAALGSAYAGLAASVTTSGLSQTVTPSSSLEHSLADFGAERIVLGSAAQAASYTTVSQAAFGGPVSSVELGLVGTHSAIPSGITATMNVYWNDFLIGSSVLGAETAIDEKLTVPTSVLTASNGLSVRLSAATTDGGLCIGSGSVPIELFLDGGASTVTGVRGESVSPGFERFPQAFGGALTVAFGDEAGGADAAAAAGAIVASLQRIAPDPFAVTVVPADDFVSSDLSGVLVGASADDAEALKTPLRLSAFTAIAGTGVDFGVDTGAAYAALQAFSTDGRDVVLLGGFAPEGTDPASASPLQSGIGAYLDALPGGWSALSGNLLVNLAGADEPVQLDSNEITPQAEVKDDFSGYAIWLVLAIVVIAALILAGWLVRRRRKRKVAEYVDAQERAADTPTD